VPQWSIAGDASASIIRTSLINKERCSNNGRNNFLAIESSTGRITCRLVLQILLVFASLTSHLITIIFYCTVNCILHKAIVNCFFLMHEFIHIVYVVCTLFAITVVQGGPKNSVKSSEIKFTGRFPGKFAVQWILKIPTHLAYVATLPCETLMSAN